MYVISLSGNDNVIILLYAEMEKIKTVTKVRISYKLALLKIVNINQLAIARYRLYGMQENSFVQKLEFMFMYVCVATSNKLAAS